MVTGILATAATLFRTCLHVALLWSVGCLLSFESGWAIEPPRTVWSPDMLRDITRWPHAETDSRITASSCGLRVEVAPERNFAIGAISHLALPADLGRIRVCVTEMGGGATWFVRLYGELRQPGQHRTAAIAQDEDQTHDRVFPVDPRLVQLHDTPIQLQLGVEGPPGAYAIFQEVEFLARQLRANRQSAPIDQPGQLEISAVAWMPNLPEPFKLIDWHDKAIQYDRFVFDLDAEGEFLPLTWLDHSRINCDSVTFGMPSYVGEPRRTPQHPGAQEGITCMGAVLGATVAGIDKRAGEHNYVRMCEAWFNARNGLNLVLNLQQQETGGSFWYEIWPHVVFYALADRYPDEVRLREIMRITADRWRQACADLADEDGIPDFDVTSFDFRARRPIDNGRWREPDAAAGVAWLQYAAWNAWQEPQHLAAAENCIRFLERRQDNAYYEILLPYGALVAARLNAEHDRQYDVHRMVEWCFGISDCRGGWGVTVGRWGDYDCDGLLGSIDNRGGYAFAMNTFAQAGALVPLVRYDTRFARAIGKWMLNVANSARLFYPGELPPDHQTSGFWHGDPQHVIAYEGLRHRWQGKQPCATGDPLALDWGPRTDLGLYGSSYVGLLGGIVRPTNVPGLLQLDCLATDFFRSAAYPTFLCYNPYDEPRAFDLAVGPDPSDLYDAVTHRRVASNVRHTAAVTLPADTAAVIVVAPAGGVATRRGRQLLINDVVVDWNAED